ncbi:MAG TPA: hypothetical protein VH877_09465 [Polyangia bacterium]|nr:hypothetical protein [Polyangia bacterium]
MPRAQTTAHVLPLVLGALLGAASPSDAAAAPDEPGLLLAQAEESDEAVPERLRPGHRKRGRNFRVPPTRDAPKPTTQPIPLWRVVFNNAFFLRYNPLGLEDQLRAGAERLLYRSDKPIARDNFFFFGLAPRLNPAFVKVGPSIEIQPLSIFNLRVTAEYVNYFSSFGFVQSFTTPNADFSDSTLAARRDRGLNYITYGAHVIIEPLLQFRFGNIVVRNRASFEYWRLNLRANDSVWYEVTLDTLISRSGWVFSNDLDVLYLTKFGFTAGVRYSVVRPFYQQSDYLAGETLRVSNNEHQRLGPLLAYTFWDRPYTRFNRPTVVLIVNWYAEHRWRTGVDVNPGIPYIVVGFGFQSDVLK